MINPEEDGVTHINIYSKGKTKLGRALTNFASLSFKHPLYGKFESMEGYWYWIKTGYQHEELRTLSGFKAKEVGNKFEVVDNPNFHVEVLQGIKCKLYQRPNLLKAVLQNNLPLKHYYCYGGKAVPAKGGINWEDVFGDIKRDFLGEK